MTPEKYIKSIFPSVYLQRIRIHFAFFGLIHIFKKMYVFCLVCGIFFAFPLDLKNLFSLFFQLTDYCSTNRSIIVKKYVINLL